MFERSRAIEDEAEDELAVMRREVDAGRRARPDRPCLGESASRRSDLSLLRLNGAKRRPWCLVRAMPHEPLAAELPVRIVAPIRKLHLVIGEGLVKCWGADLYHFEPGGAFEH